MSRSLMVVLVACACARGEGRPPGKPVAPVSVAIEARDLGGGEHELTLRATPAVDVRALSSRWVLPQGVTLLAGREADGFGATGAGERRSHTVRVRLDVAGARVAGEARVAVDARGGERSAAAVVDLGAPVQPRALPARVVTLPGGVRVSEVRP